MADRKLDGDEINAQQAQGPINRPTGRVDQKVGSGADPAAVRNKLVDFLTGLTVFRNADERQALLRQAGLNRFIGALNHDSPVATYVDALLHMLETAGGRTYLQRLFAAVANRAHLEGDPLNRFNQIKEAYLLIVDRQGRAGVSAPPGVGWVARAGVWVLPLVAVAVLVVALLLVGPWSASPFISEFFPTPTPMLTPTPLAGEPAAPGETLIIIGSFDDRSGTSSAQVDVMTRTHNELLRLAQEKNLPDVRVLVVDHPVIKNHEQAREVGQAYGAGLVIWGWRDAEGAFVENTPTETAQINVQPREARIDMLNQTTTPVCLGREVPAQGSYLAYLNLGQALIEWEDRERVELALSFMDAAITGISHRPGEEWNCSDFNPWNAYALRGHLYGTIALFAQNEGQRETAIDWRRKAIASYAESIALKGDEAWVYESKGLSELELAHLLYSDQAKESYRAAIESYSRALELDPDYAAGVYFNRGLAYAAQGDDAQAIADSTRAIELDPGYAGAYVGRGVAYRRQGEYAQAIADYTRAIELDPDDAAAYFNRGIAYAAQGEYAQAIANYTRAIELDPDYARAYNNRGNAYAAQGDDAQAIADYTRAIELDPDYANAYFNRGNAYAEQGDDAQAIADYTRAIELDPDDADAYFNRGFTYKRLGQTEAAIADFEQALELFEDEYWREEARKHLAELRGE